MRRTARILAAAGALALASGVALVTPAPAAPVATAEPSLSELLSGGDGSVMQKVEGPGDRMAAEAQIAAAHNNGLADPAAAKLAAHAQAKALPQATGQLAAAWQEIGPKPFRADHPDYSVDTLGWENLGGRTVSLATDPRDPSGNTVWAAAAGGGIWRTTDGGANWVPTFDDQPSMPMGAVALDVSSGWVYAGTGEANTNGDGLAGTGVYRTKDDGATWERVPQNIVNASTVFHIAARDGRVFVASNRGLFRSADGGDSYENVLLPTNAAGTAPYDGLFGNFVTDVRIAPDDPEQITAAVGWRRGKKAGNDGKPDSEGNGLYRSTEGGAPGTWERMPALGLGLPGLSSDPLGRISLAYAEGEGQNHDLLWAVVQDAGAFRGETFLDVSTAGAPKPTVLAGVFLSIDDGLTWTRKADASSFASAPGTSVGPLIALGSGPGVQAWYDQYVEVDPVDQNRVLVGLEEVYVTVANATGPGEAEWTTLGRYWNTCALVINCEGIPTYEGKTTHADQHAAAFAPTGEGVRLYVSGDGGVFRQDSHPTTFGQGYDNQSWEFVNSTYVTTQPYYAAMGSDGTIYAGLQDNGTLKVLPGTTEGFMTLGGDGVDVAVDPEDSNIAYGETQNAGWRKTADGGVNWSAVSPGLTTPLFLTPFELDPVDPDHLVIGGREVKETTAGTATGTADWVTSYDLGSNSRTGFGNQISAVDLHGTAVYAGFCGVCDIITQGNNDPMSFQNGIATNVQRGCEASPGTDACWHVAAAKNLPNRYITDIAVDPANVSTIYVTIGGYGRRWLLPDKKTPGVGTGNVFVSHDAGETFRDISGVGATALPDTPANAVTVRDGRLVVGTDNGVFTAPPGGSNWARLGTGLPNVPVFDVNLDPQGKKLVVATHGRGVWVYDFGAPASTKVPIKRGSTKPVRTARPGGPSTPATGGLPLAGLGVVLLAAAAFAARRPRGREGMSAI